MIIAQEVLRFITIRALKGRTWVKDRVFDSPAQPADLTLSEDRAAFIAVYTDDADMVLDGESLSGSDATVYLTIEIAVAEPTTVDAAVPNADQDPTDTDIDRVPGGETVMQLAQTDEALELTIGLISRQVSQALMAPDNPWGELWRHLTSPGRDKVEVRRGGPGQETDQRPPAVRYASRIVRMVLRVLGEPDFREGINPAPPPGFPAAVFPAVDAFWPKFFAHCAADPDPNVSAFAMLIRNQMEGDPLTTWRIDQIRGTLTEKALVAMGITPLPQVLADEQEPGQLRKVTEEETGATFEPIEHVILSSNLSAAGPVLEPGEIS